MAATDFQLLANFLDATKKGDTDFVQDTLKANSIAPTSIATGLLYAVMFGQTEMVRLLLASGADANASGGMIIKTAEEYEQAKIARLLKDSVAAKEAERVARCATTMADAEVTEHVEAAAVQDGPTPAMLDYILCLAASIGDKGAVEYALKAGANPNASDGKPLRLAANSGRIEVVRLLVDAGADPKK